MRIRSAEKTETDKKTGCKKAARELFLCVIFKDSSLKFKGL